MSTPSLARDRPTVVVGPSRGWIGLRLSELWEYRDLCYFLAWRDVKVRYKQTVFGGAWAVLQPLMLMVVFTVFLHHLGHVGSQGTPYALFTYTALVPWTMFASALTAAADSLVSNSALVSKVYFPKLLLTIGAIAAPIVDFAISFALLGLMLVAWGITPPLAALWVPLLFLLALLTAFAAGVWLAALNVRYRDFRYTLPFMVTLLLFATPVAYASTSVSPSLRWLYALNPMAGVVDGFRWALLGAGHGPGATIAVSIGAMLVLLVSGLAYFTRVERSFADVI
jgi:lipopolysaccharide transport system permease protein